MGTAAYHASGIVVAHAHGVRITGEDGQEYLDACSGTFNVGLGYGNAVVARAIVNAIETGLLHGSSSLRTHTVMEAEKRLCDIAPIGLDRVHLKGCTGGSTAFEQAVRHAWAVTGRNKIVGFRGGHHGQTIASSILSGMSFRKERLRHVAMEYEDVPAPDCYRCPYGRQETTCHVECATAVIRAVRPTHGHLAAAFVAEPVLGAGGGIVPPAKFWLKVADELSRLKVPLIADEVQTFGRVGGYFASDYYQIKPTIITLAKSLSGIGLPGAGAVLLPRDFCVLDEGERSLTGGSASIVCAAISATLDIMSAPGFFKHVEIVASAIDSRLTKIAANSSKIGLVRAAGLMTGIELVDSKTSRTPDPKFAKALVNACKRNGLLVRQSEYGRGSFVKIRPALTTQVSEAEEMCDRLSFSVIQCERGPVWLS
jgi:4-aminobutyrate aminotransferase